MLSLQFKSAASVDLTPHILRFLRSSYSEEESKRFEAAVRSLQEMRSAVDDIRSHDEGVRRALFLYLDQIEKVKFKLPIGDPSLRVPILWMDTMTRKRPSVQFSWDLERASVLFNVGALESKQGVAQDRSTPEGAKAATKNFVAAATAFAHLRDAVRPPTPENSPFDLTGPALSFFTSFFLGQAQVSTLELARMAERTGAPPFAPRTLAQLAFGAAAYYREARDALAGPLEKAANEVFPWTLWAEFQATSLDATGYWELAAVELAEAERTAHGYGKEVAYLRQAVGACRAAQAAVAAMRTRGLKEVPVDSLLALQEMVTKRLATAEDKNLRVYMERIPEFKELAAVPELKMARLPATPFDPTSLALPFLPKDLFADLLRPAVAAAVNETETRAKEEVRAQREAGRKAFEDANARLAALGLPGSLDAGETASGLPDRLWERVRKVQARGGIADLDARFVANSDHIRRALDFLRQAAARYTEDNADHTRWARTYGDRWTPATTAALAHSAQAELQRTQALIDEYAAKDETTRRLLEASRSALAALGYSREELARMIPTATEHGAGGVAERDHVRRLLVQLANLQEQRTRAIEDFEAATARHRIVSAFVSVVMGGGGSGGGGGGGGGAVGAAGGGGGGAAGGGRAPTAALPVGGSGTLSEEVKSAAMVPIQTATEALRGLMARSMEAQTKLLEEIAAANERYLVARSADASLRARSEALQRVQAATDRFEELMTTVTDAGNFYGDLDLAAERLLGQARDFKYSRDLERQDLLAQLGAGPEAYAGSPGGGGGLGGSPTFGEGGANPFVGGGAGGFGAGGFGAGGFGGGDGGGSGAVAVLPPDLPGAGAAPTAPPGAPSAPGGWYPTRLG